jgi:hypothetical protein
MLYSTKDDNDDEEEDSIRFRRKKKAFVFEKFRLYAYLQQNDILPLLWLTLRFSFHFPRLRICTYTYF